MVTARNFKSALGAAGWLTVTAAMPIPVALAGVTNTGDLSANRSSAQLTVTVQCEAPFHPGESKAGNLTVHLFQPSGRLLNIGVGTAPILCDGVQANVIVNVDAIPGLKFKPGPATVVLKLTEQTTDANGAVTNSTTTESGDTVNLRP